MLNQYNQEFWYGDKGQSLRVDNIDWNSTSQKYIYIYIYIYTQTIKYLNLIELQSSKVNVIGWNSTSPKLNTIKYLSLIKWV